MITAEHVVIATGSEAVPLPMLPFGEPVVSSADALSFDSVPEPLVVVGAGYIGLELGIAYRKLGVGGYRRRGADARVAAVRR